MKNSYTLPASSPDLFPKSGSYTFLFFLLFIVNVLKWNDDVSKHDSWDFPGGPAVKTLCFH